MHDRTLPLRSGSSGRRMAAAGPRTAVRGPTATKFSPRTFRAFSRDARVREMHCLLRAAKSLNQQ